MSKFGVTIGLVVSPNKNGNGLLVEDVEEGSRAANKGLRAGDVILEVDNLPVNNIVQLEEILDRVRAEERTTVLIKAERGGNVMVFQ